MPRRLDIRRSLIIALLMVLSLMLGGAAAPTSADGDVEERIAEFWRRIDAMQPGDHLSAADLGQWALNVIARDPRARVTVADFRASTASMQGGIDRAGPAPVAAVPTPAPSTTPGGPGMSGEPMWAWNGSQWGNLGGPAPECPPVLPSAIELSLATSVLYPGQVRGDYKAHGGFRFDGLAPNDIEVHSPIDGILVRAAHYLASGELQYTLDLIHPCGLMVRLGHLRELTPELTAIFEDFPPPVELDSRSTYLNPAVPIAAGDLVATSVGLYTTNNTFIDIGMYDLRHRNESSEDPAWLAQHNNDTYAYGLCWFGLLGADAEAAILALPPADGVMGDTSDYCQ